MKNSLEAFEADLHRLAVDEIVDQVADAIEPAVGFAEFAQNRKIFKGAK